MMGSAFLVRRYTASDGMVVYYREVNGLAWIKSDVEVELTPRAVQEWIEGVTE